MVIVEYCVIQRGISFGIPYLNIGTTLNKCRSKMGPSLLSGCVQWGPTILILHVEVITTAEAVCELFLCAIMSCPD